MTKGFQNLHSHTSYCDGNLTAEEMVMAAIEKGGSSIGFSEHSYLYFEDSQYAISPDEIPLYIREVNEQKEKYGGQIDVFLGMEQDVFTEEMPEGLDYIIGSVHFIKHNGKFLTIDNTYETLLEIRDEYFSGDFLSVVEGYYETAADIAVKTKADIIGHFDIITKQNDGGRLFDESGRRYKAAALCAMDKLLENCRLFEINTGAMYRKGNITQYPSEFLLRELHKRGGEIIFSSDSHDGNSLYYKFDEMYELAKSCGFKYYKRLTKEGFADEAL